LRIAAADVDVVFATIAYGLATAVIWAVTSLTSASTCIVGCIVGLMNVMANLNEPASLGPKIAAAFVATLWGVMAANFWFLPMGAKILRVSELKAAQMEMLVEGITEIQAGTSPRAVRLKLNSLIPPSELAKEAA